MSWVVWAEAARPRTLGASVVPVVVGAASTGTLDPLRFAGTLVVALAFQVGVNYANDYFDAVKGVDTPERRGPRRLVAASVVQPRQMKRAAFAAFAVAVAAGSWLVLVAGWALLVLGAASLIAALAYSGGPRPYGSAALGELFVFVFFGVVATVGSAYVQVEKFSALALMASIPVGLLAVSLLIANNVRDIDTDKTTGKRTLPVKIGAKRSRRLFRLCIFLSYVWVPVVALSGGGLPPLLALVSSPAAAAPLKDIASEDPDGLIEALAGAARLQIVFGLLLAGGLWLGTAK
ncbi:MAG: 1,4-dihydroxy-2-naphthoate polyprenyltransferase [Actinomycetota bacterium]